MTKKILFFIFPLHYYLLLLLAILLSFSELFTSLSNYVFNLIFILLSLRIGILLHEVGHLSFAKMVGGNPKRMILGKGHEILRFEAYNIKVILNNKFNSGLALATFNSLSYYKLRLLIYTMGGVVTNVLMAYLVFIIYDFNLNYLTLTDVSFSSAFIVANVVLAFINLIPFYTNYQGVKLASDGLSLVKIPFKKINKEGVIDNNELFEAYELYESKHYDKAISIYEKYMNFEDTKLLASINLSLQYAKIGNIEKAYSTLESCLPLVEDKKLKPNKAIVYNALAWYGLLKKDYTNIDLHSKTAISISPKNSNFQGTRGAVLIELGHVDQGVAYLKPIVNFKFPNNETLSAAMYLYYALHLKKDDKEKSKYLKFIKDNIKRLELDDTILWEIILDKVRKE